MTETNPSTDDYYEPGIYEIRIQGHIDDSWAEWLGGLTIKREENGDTLLTALVVDQAALFGLLRKVRDVGRPLLSLIYIEPHHSDAPDFK
ncbi:MAG: hypothetical protein ISR58_15845 [Anaerolineales bacterium]|nr:hypothetical protein [Chloroflexota bacterium]MBL6982646.1 hypothetical protein [Anaerolineales bacterium]